MMKVLALTAIYHLVLRRVRCPTWSSNEGELDVEDRLLLKPFQTFFAIFPFPTSCLQLTLLISNVVYTLMYQILCISIDPAACPRPIPRVATDYLQQTFAVCLGKNPRCELVFKLQASGSCGPFMAFTPSFV
jgi:hypothetical protein